MKLLCNGGGGCGHAPASQAGLHVFPVLALFLQLDVQGVVQLAQLFDPKSIIKRAYKTGFVLSLRGISG